MSAESRRRSRTGLILMGAGLGALAAFVFDPVSGRRRRARVRDKTLSLGRDALDLAGRKVRDLSHRLKGKVYIIKSEFQHEVEVDDMTLLLRVRSHMGHDVSHARSIHVDVHRGTVILTGPILAEEVEALIRCVEKVPGVKEVRDMLDVHEDAAHVPGLQGEDRFQMRFKGGDHGAKH